MFGSNKVHPNSANSSDEEKQVFVSPTSIQISQDLGDVNASNEFEAESESKQTANIESERDTENREDQLEPDSGGGGANSTPSTPTRQDFNPEDVRAKNQSVRPRARTGSSAFLFRRTSSDVEERDVYMIGGSLETEHLQKNDWAKHPWRWPNEKDAKAYGEHHVFEEGKAKFLIGNDALQKRMGVGIVL